MPTSGACHVLAFDSPQFVAHRRRFARLRYIVWGCAGYQGNCDIDDDLVSPVGFSNRQEARQCAAAMTAACEDHCDSSAEIINKTPGLEWDGAESYYVATLTLPSALNWDGGDAFGALAATPTLVVETGRFAAQKLRAISCHRSQFRDCALALVDQDDAPRLIGTEHYRRADAGAQGDTFLERFAAPFRSARTRPTRP